MFCHFYLFWIPCQRLLLISSQRRQFVDFQDWDFWEFWRLTMFWSSHTFTFFSTHISTHCKRLVLSNRYYQMISNQKMSKPKGANSKMVLIRQFHLCLWSHKIFQIGKIFFNFPGAPFMAGAKRSQFGQFAQRVPSNSPQTDVFSPFSPFLEQISFSAFLHVFSPISNASHRRKL